MPKFFQIFKLTRPRCTSEDKERVPASGEQVSGCCSCPVASNFVGHGLVDAHVSGVVCRWEAAQTLARKLMLDLVGKAQKGDTLQLAPAFVAALKNVLTDPALDKVRTAASPNNFVRQQQRLRIELCCRAFVFNRSLGSLHWRIAVDHKRRTQTPRASCLGPRFTSRLETSLTEQAAMT